MKRTINHDTVPVVTQETIDAVGVSSPQPKYDIPFWHIAIVQPKCEKILGDILTKNGHPVFLPIRKKTVLDKQGKEKVKEQMLFYGKVFVKVSPRQRRQLMDAGIARKFMIDIASRRDEYGHRGYARIPDYQMDTFMAMLAQEESEVIFEEYNFKVGDRVRVKAGPLGGKEGYVTRCPDGKSYLSITIDHLGCAKMQIDATLVEVISNTNRND